MSTRACWSFKADNIEVCSCVEIIVREVWSLHMLYCLDSKQTTFYLCGLYARSSLNSQSGVIRRAFVTATAENALSNVTSMTKADRFDMTFSYRIRHPNGLEWDV